MTLSVGSLVVFVMEGDFQRLFINIEEKQMYRAYSLNKGKSCNISARSNPHLKKRGSSFKENTFILIPWNV